MFVQRSFVKSLMHMCLSPGEKVKSMRESSEVTAESPGCD